MKKVHIYIFAAFICTALALTGCNDKAVTLSDITEENGQDVPAEGVAAGGDVQGEQGADSAAASDAEHEPVTIMVYICGCVESPGVYELPKGSRICDGLEAAGGFSEGADESRINLAGYLSDGDMVYFPEEGEDIPEGAAGVTASTPDVNTGSSSADRASGLVNINTAGTDLLCTLPGIGATKAASIIKYREENGAFTDISQIMNVSGIGENLYNNIKELICV